MKTGLSVVLEIRASQRANEPVWGDRTGRAAAMMEAIEKAFVGIDRTADWVRDGMALNDPLAPSRPMVRFAPFVRAMPNPTY